MLPLFVSTSSIEFYLGYEESYKQIVTVYNPYPFAIKYQVYCTADEKYAVTNPSGKIRPQHCADILIKHKFPETSNVNISDKFKIEINNVDNNKVLGCSIIMATVYACKPTKETEEKEVLDSTSAHKFTQEPYSSGLKPKEAVLCSEVVKFCVCLILVFFEKQKNFKKLLSVFTDLVIQNYVDTLKVCIPSLLYVIQNNLLYLSASNLDAATYQVTYQLKILTTAVFAVVILKRSLKSLQWFSLVQLIIGVVLVQLSQGGEQHSSINQIGQSKVIGISAALGACVLSGFAGIYFEKILKGSDISVWIRNIQLSFLSIPFGILTCFGTDAESIKEKGFFFGYDIFVWYLVVLQACGGLLVAAVVKYADNILKGFATSLAIVLSCVGSVYLFHFKITFQFIIGTSLVIGSVFIYSYVPSPKSVSFEPRKQEVRTRV